MDQRLWLTFLGPPCRLGRIQPMFAVSSTDKLFLTLATVYESTEMEAIYFNDHHAQRHSFPRRSGARLKTNRRRVTSRRVVHWAHVRSSRTANTGNDLVAVDSSAAFVQEATELVFYT